MKATLAFWNVQLGPESPKIKFEKLREWFREIFPDILVLEEVSENTWRNVPAFREALSFFMQPLTSAAQFNLTSKKLDNTKSIWAFVSDRLMLNLGLETSGTPVRVDLGETTARAKRLKLKINIARGKNVLCEIHAYHANASRAASLFTREFRDILGPTRNPGIAGGDLNNPIQETEGIFSNENLQTIWPLGYNMQPLPFTQWRKEIGSLEDYRQLLAQFGIESMPATNFHIQSGNVIDYVVVNESTQEKLSLRALPNCTSMEVTRDILLYFDHFPVVYEFTIARSTVRR